MTYSRGRMRRIAHLEALADRRFQHQQTRRTAFDKRLHDGCFAVLANICVIILYGTPRINEPLGEAWKRSLTALLSEFPGFAGKGCVSPFHSEADALLIACDFRTYLLPRLPGADDSDKVYRVLSNGPQWLLWHAHADECCRTLGGNVPDLSRMRHFSRGDWYLGVLPEGSFELRELRADEHKPAPPKKTERGALASPDERSLREQVRACRVQAIRRLLVKEFNEKVARGEIDIPPYNPFSL